MAADGSSISYLLLGLLHLIAACVQVIEKKRAESVLHICMALVYIFMGSAQNTEGNKGKQGKISPDMFTQMVNDCNEGCRGELPHICHGPCLNKKLEALGAAPSIPFGQEAPHRPSASKKAK